MWWLCISEFEARARKKLVSVLIIHAHLPAWSIPAGPLEKIKAWKSAPWVLKIAAVKKYTNIGQMSNILSGWLYSTKHCVWSTTSVSQQNVLRRSLLLFRVKPEGRRGSLSWKWVNAILQQLKKKKGLRSIIKISKYIHNASHKEDVGNSSKTRQLSSSKKTIPSLSKHMQKLLAGYSL